MKALLIPVNGLPTEVTLRADGSSELLGAMQDLVGGDLEQFAPLEDEFGAYVYVNGDGLGTRPPNRAVFATEAMERTGYLSQMDFSRVSRKDELYTILSGPILVVGVDRESEDYADLTDEQVALATRYFTEVSSAGSGKAAVDRVRCGLDTTRHEGRDYTDVQRDLFRSLGDPFDSIFDMLPEDFFDDVKEANRQREVDVPEDHQRDGDEECLS